MRVNVTILQSVIRKRGCRTIALSPYADFRAREAVHHHLGPIERMTPGGSEGDTPRKGIRGRITQRAEKTLQTVCPY